MSKKFDIKNYLKKLEKVLKEKQLDSFFVIADRKDFKPITGYYRPKDLTDMFASKIQYYAGKRAAHISLFTHIKGLKTDEFIFSIKIIIYKILDNGSSIKLSQDINDTLGIRVNYEPDDFESRKFHIKDVEKLMRLCADKTLNIDPLNGNWYKKIIKMLKKKGIDFEND